MTSVDGQNINMNFALVQNINSFKALIALRGSAPFEKFFLYYSSERKKS